MCFEIKLIVAPILNHFYNLYDVSYHEERIYKKGCSQHSRNVVKGYNSGKKAVIKHIKNGGSKDELMTVFENAFSKFVKA